MLKTRKQVSGVETRPYRKIETIPMSRIMVPDFQRPEDRGLIDRIMANFDYFAFQYPLFWHNNGYYWTLDGQQRVVAAKGLEIESVEGCVVYGYSKVQAAELYLRVNRDRKNLTPLDKFVGALAMRDEGSLAIRRILRDFGLGVRDVRAIATVQVIYAERDEDGLRRILSIIDRSWGLSFDKAKSRAILLGLDHYLHVRRPDASDDNVVAKLSVVPPVRLILGAKNRSPAFGVEAPTLLSAEIESVVDKRRRKSA